MTTNLPLSALRTLVRRFPAVVPHLRGRARWVAYTSLETIPLGNGWSVNLHGLSQAAEDNKWFGAKTYDYFLTTMQNLIRSVYTGVIAGEFIDITANLISGQLRQAFTQAWADEEGVGELPDYLAGALEDMILSEYEHVDSFYREIVDAQVDETPIAPLLSRAAVWANRWNEAYNTAVALIASENGGNLVWVYGDAEHCDTCRSLNGIVARASEWETLGVHPQGAPNDLLECGGWRCQCSLQPTEKRRSAGAFDRIITIVSK